MKLADISANRLKSVLACDKEELSTNALKMIKADIVQVLDSYFVLKRESVFINCNIDAMGEYVLTVRVVVPHIKHSGIFIGKR